MKRTNLLATLRLPLILACLSLIACKSKQGITTEQPTDNQSVVTPKSDIDLSDLPVITPMPRPLPGPVISLKTTPAYGINPVFELRIFKDGLVTWLGKEDTPMLGNFEARVSPEEVQTWLIRSQKDRFFELADDYPLNGRLIADFSNTISFVQFEEQKKTITNNYDAPVVLRKWEQDLVSWANTLPWTGVSVLVD